MNQPLEDNIIKAQLLGIPTVYDEETDTWYVGADPGFDPDVDIPDVGIPTQQPQQPTPNLQQ